MTPNILIATPHNRLEPEAIRSIFTQTYTGRRDNLFTCRNDNPVPGLNIVAAYQRIRAVFLADASYTHLWIVENDLIVPPTALEQLLAVGADIAYGTYCFRRGTPVVNVMHKDTCNTMTDNAAQWKRDFTTGRVVDCTGLGFGCTLIARHVIERFEMRTHGGGGDTDTCLAQDAQAAGLSQRAHLGVVCGHIRPDGVTLWPAATQPFYRKVGVEVPILASVRALEAFGHWDEHGRPTLLEKGQVGDLDYELAASLAARGLLEYAGPPPQPVFKDIA